MADKDMTDQQVENLQKIVEEGVLSADEVEAIRAADAEHRQAVEPEVKKGKK